MPSTTLSVMEGLHIGPDVRIQIRRSYRGETVIYISCPDSMNLAKVSRKGVVRPFRTPAQQIETALAVEKIARRTLTQ